MDDGAVPAALSRDTLKRAAGIAGTALCLVAAALLLRRGLALGDSLGERLSEIPATSLLVALALYTSGALALAGAWCAVVQRVSAAPVNARPLLVAHLRSQVAKYLPGNVFHFAYRHVAARAEGVGHRALGAALALESMLLITVAALLAVGVVSDPRVRTLLPWAHDVLYLAPLIGVLVCAVIVVGARRIGPPDASRRTNAATLVGVFAIDLAFFLLAGLALRVLCVVPDVLPLGAWWAWLALAWVVGYVTPGAPAGLGLREAVLALGLSPVLGEADALALALAYRLVTVLADALLAGIGFLLVPRPKASPRV